MVVDASLGGRRALEMELNCVSNLNCAKEQNVDTAPTASANSTDLPASIDIAGTTGGTANGFVLPA